MQWEGEQLYTAQTINSETHRFSHIKVVAESRKVEQVATIIIHHIDVGVLAKEKIHTADDKKRKEKKHKPGQTCAKERERERELVHPALNHFSQHTVHSRHRRLHSSAVGTGLGCLDG